jgi:predicted MFS family arabinose efflux permease
MRNFFGGFFAALYSLFVLREIGLTPALLGILVGSGGVGALFGAVISARLINRFGLGRSIVVAGFFSGLLALLIPLAGGPPLAAFAILLAGQLFGDAFLAVYMIAQLSLRQSVTPDRLLGRVNASFEFLVGAIATFGIMTGGLVGQWLGLRPASAVAATGILLSTLILFFSPLRHMHDPAEWEVQ